MLVFDGHEVKREANRRPSDNEMVFMALRCPKQDEIRQVLGKMYDCHDLVIEDCLRKEQHPKLNIYNDHAFFPFFFLKEDWELVQISVVMGKNFVIAILSEEMSFLAGLEQEFQQSPEKMKDPGRILYEFLDLCVHHYVEFIDSIEEIVDNMESEIYEHKGGTVNSPDSVASEIFSLKRRLHRIRRVFGDERNVVEGLMHGGFPYTKTENNPFLMDLYEHINRTVDNIDGFRDALSGLLDLQMSIKGDRMNEIMKTLAIVSTFFMPISFIVGLYGTNVKVPEYGWKFGYLWVWCLILSSSIGLWIYYKKKRWF